MDPAKESEKEQLEQLEDNQETRVSGREWKETLSRKERVRLC